MRYKNIILAALVLFCATSIAYSSQTLVNAEVSVDVTGKDAADARSQAMAKAQVDGLLDLLGRFTLPGQAQEIVAGLDPRKMGAMVRGTEVLEEKIAENRYRARLLVSFDGDDISALVSQAHTDKTKIDVAPPLGAFLIIPAYEENGIPMLWEADNVWRAVWRKVGIEINSGDVVVPYGDAKDAAALDVAGVSSATYASMVPLISRYGVSDVVIVQAKVTQNPDLVLEIVKRRFNRTQNEVNLLTYRADPQETKDMLLARAARDIAERIQFKKTEELSDTKNALGGERHEIMMLANISTLSSWTELRKKLSTLPMVDKIDVLAISPQQVDIMVYYRGTPESLVAGINAQKIRLVQNPNYWVISRD
ncbi:MAG: DUF2066 domain-containing protein [Alphaproteobacteria bacterium]|nr:DUF2066 domain-containing protein [Alphaproteobacteria bacterium]